MPSLFVIRGNDQGARFELDVDTVTIGRERSNTIQLHDTEISRRHAEVRREGNSGVLVDLSSSNGTYVNGHKVTQATLASGDHVQLGGTLMLYTAASEDSVRDLSDRVNITARALASDSSRIVRSISQEEGSRLLDPQLDPAESPWLARARNNLQFMYRTALAVSHTLDIDQLLSRIMQLIFEWVEADRGCIMLVDPDTKRFVPKVRRDRKGMASDEQISISQTILDYVQEHNEGVLTSNAKDDRRWDPAASILQVGVREAICVPMRGRYDVVGVIYIDTLTPSDRYLQLGAAKKFNDEHLKLMIAIAHQAALAVEDTRYYSAMVQAERLAAVGQTIATLSHHVKNILQGIRGGSYLIEMGLTEHDETIVRKGWDIVEKNQNKISTLVLDMLTFSKEREPDLAPSQMNEVVADVVELMQTRASDMDVELTVELQPDLPLLTFDPDGLHRAVLNIVTNAIDACDREGDPGRVRVSTSYDASDQKVRVIVEDNGTGIAPEDMEKVFTLFVSRKGGRGTGLGLPVSAKIVNEHGGRIDVQSTVGQGSRFTLELPAIPVDSPPPGPKSTGETSTGQTSTGIAPLPAES